MGTMMRAIEAEFCTFNRVIPVQGAIDADLGRAASADWLAPGAWIGRSAPRETAAPSPDQQRRETGARARDKARIRGLNALDYLTGGLGDALA
jgi:hypothetical protein